MLEPFKVLTGFHRPFYAGPSPISPHKVFICDFSAGCVRTDDRSFFFNGLKGPHSIDWDKEGFAYVAEFYGGRILKIKEGFKEEVFLEKLPGPASAFFNPEKSLLYVTDFAASTVSYYNLKGECLGQLEGLFNRPHSICFGDDGRLYVADTHHHSIACYDQDHQLAFHFGTPHLAEPVSVSFYKNSIYTCEFGSDAVKKFSADGKFQSVVLSGLAHPYGVKIDHDGTLYVADSDHGSIKLYSLSSQLPLFS